MALRPLRLYPPAACMRGLSPPFGCPSAALRAAAAQALKINRVAAHVDRALTSAGLTRGEDSSIVLYCGEKMLPPDMNLLTVRVFYWKQGGDMVFTYAEAR